MTAGWGVHGELPTEARSGAVSLVRRPTRTKEDPTDTQTPKPMRADAVKNRARILEAARIEIELHAVQPGGFELAHLHGRPTIDIHSQPHFTGVRIHRSLR